MKIGDQAKASPVLTGLDNWIEGTVVNVWPNPFLGVEVAIKDNIGEIFFGEEKYFEQISGKEACLQ
ncbi:hypothetical protein Barb6_00821 [Bacteroidales bacterium Barb6]|nr:hypothetical protein Barb6_00821 [Bacteroidales bacterium Barb6]